ncbi:Subtilisin-like protease SBT1.2 [Dichanthelium oligosanthes]|uniref:Subtilisin-like protease SBT1.2 n=1 Tax=Dichanthelium oligosanthes TaxID=888268 RepID=A0A1E5VAI1_9POAL|nr:Subtilisin-like protease SBT1.2 [Dichanthelium oligosanthes]
MHDAVRSTNNMGEGVVIGVLDDGIDAGHPSFGDEGMTPPPARWRGRCKHAGVAACNNKLVGAREFTRHLRHPAGPARTRGAGTHGTHASSIAAGALVRRADADGGAAVSGVAPRAHLAFYQVCAARGCSRGPVMHAVETALADGVDILSMSLGDDDGVGFHEDPVVAATFSAVMKGVFVCAAAGNKGPTAGSVANDAPWILTVGASSQSSPQSITNVAAFSSRGPSRNNGGVLKPDIVGPGVDILAAVPRSRRGSGFASLSGTSMSAPHLSGVAALIKSAHPTWSPAAIKSAMITTADTSVTDENGSPASYFAMGAGLVNAAKAIDPGLVYDISPEEYIPYLCGLGYTDDQVNRIIYPAPVVHCAEMESTEAKDLNTPSVMVALTADRPAVTVRRTVTNVGAARSVYRVDVSAPEGVSITVTPTELQFDEFRLGSVCSSMDAPNPMRLAAPLSLHVTVFLLASLLVSTAVAHHDLGLHKNYLIIVHTPYEYDRNLFKDVSSWHASLLASVCDMAEEELDKDPSAMTRLIYSYRHVINGFAARLTDEELRDMATKDWFVKAMPEKTYKLMTTHTPQMLGLTGQDFHAGLWKRSNMGEGIIIGVLDDGIRPGHPSFDATGMKPPPAKWKGRCDFNSSVCNNKLIGARSFYESAKWKWKGIDDPVLPISEGSHGTHTSSTAAGAFVPGANVMGNGLGTASGMAPRAHIALYQVCFEDKGCDRDDILAALDDAVEEGVDVLSLSLGDDEAGDFAYDPIALGGYTAIMKGVFVSAAAGNMGPDPATVANEAPWLLTVAAATTDRRFVASVKLGNGVELDGESLFQPKNFPSVQRPLVRDLSDGTCSDEKVLTPQHVGGKIVVCDAGGNFTTLEMGAALREAGAAGMIVINIEELGSVIQPKAHALPASQVPYRTGQKIRAYMNSTKNPTGELIFKGTVLGIRDSPVVAAFSSRGPSKQNQGILKPDITGPGVNIIAGVPKPAGLMMPPNPLAAKFDILSGTSMATPHLSGIAAVIKKAHPTWTPAAIKSALITTADTMDHLRKPIAAHDGYPANLLTVGAGFVNPMKALRPGLVYNLTAADYIPYLCGLRYSDHEINSIIHPLPPVSCAKMPAVAQKDLNYPSITAFLDQEPYVVNVSRVVTNVGRAKSVYIAKVEVPGELSVTVMPDTLRFKKMNQAKRFTVTIRPVGAPRKKGIAEGQLKWVSPNNVVHTPILVAFKKFVQDNSSSAHLTH